MMERATKSKPRGAHRQVLERIGASFRQTKGLAPLPACDEGAAEAYLNTHFATVLRGLLPNARESIEAGKWVASFFDGAAAPTLNVLIDPATGHWEVRRVRVPTGERGNGVISLMTWLARGRRPSERDLLALIGYAHLQVFAPSGERL